jgi:hypothetical protein
LDICAPEASFISHCTSDPALFPKEAGSATRIRNFNDLWIVEMVPLARGTLLKHVVFDIALERQRRQ